MAIDKIQSLLNKVDNKPDEEAGVLRAEEFVNLVSTVIDHDKAISGAIKGIKYNDVLQPIEGGIVYIDTESASRYKLAISEDSERQLPETISYGNDCYYNLKVSMQYKSDDGEFYALPGVGKIVISAGPGTHTIENVKHGDTFTVNIGKYFSPDAYNSVYATLYYEPKPGDIYKVETLPVKSVHALTFSLDIQGARTILRSSDEVSNYGYMITSVGDESYLDVYVDNHLELSDIHLQNNVQNTDIIKELFKHSDVSTTHGQHTLKFIAKSISYPGITTKEYSYKYIYINETLSKPIILCSLLDNAVFDEYGTLSCTYTIYSKNATADETVNISIIKPELDNGIIVKDENGKTVGISVLTNTPKISFVGGLSQNNTVKLALFGSSDIPGNRIFRIELASTGEFIEIPVVINASTISIESVPNADVALTSNNKSQTDGPNWKNGGENNTEHVKEDFLDLKVDFDGFEFVDSGSGWYSPEEYTACVIKKGRFVKIHHRPFENGPVIPRMENGILPDDATITTARTLSFQFTTRNCINKDTSIIRCRDERGVGIEIFANKIVVKGDDIASTLTCEYRENTMIKVDVVIQSLPKRFKIKTYGWPKKQDADGNWVDDTDADKQEVFEQETYEALAIVYLDGVYQGLISLNDISYKQTRLLTEEDIANDDELQREGYTAGQNDPRYKGEIIEIGSHECDIDLYTVRSYSTDLSVQQILQNYAYDIPKPAEKINIFLRNNIFANNNDKTGRPTISLQKLETARPDLPQIFVTLDHKVDALPYDKSDWRKLIRTELDNPMNYLKEHAGLDAPSFLTVGRLKNQGTSSMNYPWPWRNWDWSPAKEGAGNIVGLEGADTVKFKIYDDLAKKWPQYFGMPGDGIKKITFKKDYASAEMCNNAICSDFFDYMAKAVVTETTVDGKVSKWVDVLSPTMKKAYLAEIDNPTYSGTKWSDYRLALKAIPSFMWHDVHGDKSELEPLGMMNIIPNKNEVVYLGMDLADGARWDGEENRCQSWEICENKTFWTASEIIHYTEKTNSRDGYVVPEFWDATNKQIKNPIHEVYEARYPKDSTIDWGVDSTGEKYEADFGMVPDGASVSGEQFTAWYNEVKDIIEFHNWVCSTNRADATNQPLANSLTVGDTTYTKDTEEYRLAKFKTEAPERLIINQWLLYYIWREQFWMFDSGSKNLQLYTMGHANDDPSKPLQWGCMVRDADTALGIDNQGRLRFPAYLEDTDTYRANADGTIEFNFDGAKNIYSNDKLNGWEPVLNGQLGALWVNIRDAYGPELKTLYKDLYDAKTMKFNASTITERFDKHQEKWSEGLYNFGMSQYYGGPEFTKWIKSGVGNKKHQRKSWLNTGVFYRASKYRALGDNDCLAMRRTFYDATDAENYENTFITIKPYSPMWVGISVGTSSQSGVTNDGNIRVTDVNVGAKYPAELFFSGGASSGDAHTYIFGISNLTDIGDLARFCKVTTLTGLNSSKLLSLKLGDHTGTYKENINGKIVPISNTKLDTLNCSSLPALTYLDVTNHSVLTSLTVNTNKQLVELYAEGTPLNSLNIPYTSTLQKLWLGNKLVKLTLHGLTGILSPAEYAKLKNIKVNEKTFSIQSCNFIEEIDIKECSSYINEYSYNILRDTLNKPETYTEVDKNGDTVVKQHAKLKSCKIQGANWQNCSVKILENLCSLIKSQSDLVLSGKINIPSNNNADENYNMVSSEFKRTLINRFKQVDDPNGSLYIKYFVNPTTEVNLLSTMYVNTVKNGIPIEYSVNEGANDFMEFNFDWHPDDKYMAEEYGTFDNSTASLNVKKVGTEADAPTFRYTCTVKTISGKEIQGTGNIAFYEREPKLGDIVYHDGTTSSPKEINRNKIPIGVCFYIDENDKSFRLMCALKDIKSLTISAIGTDSSTDTVSLVKFGPSTSSRITLQNPVTFTHVEGLNRYSALFEQNLKWRDLRNSDNTAWTTDINVQQGKQPRYAFGELGYKTVENTTLFEGITLSDSSFKISYGDKLPYGQYNTLAIISLRNQVLTDPIFDDVSDVSIPHSIYDEKTGNETSMEYSVVQNNMINTYEYFAKSSGHQYMHDIYYPAASFCYGYAPYQQTSGMPALLNKFKKHNWFLPSGGEMVRLAFFVHAFYNPSEFDKGLNIFKDVYALSAADRIDPNISSDKKFHFDGFEDHLPYLMSSGCTKDDAVFSIDVHNSGSTAGQYETITVLVYNANANFDRAVRPICRF
jgi:hypothetical protein